jgi:hypothetical protein
MQIGTKSIKILRNRWHVLKKIARFLKNQITSIKRLTISGEINIGTNTGFKGNIGEIEQGVATIIEAIKKDNPFLKIQCKRELYELTVKIFTFHKLFIDRAFLESMRHHLQSFMDYICHFDGLKLRLNVYGEMCSLTKNEKFRYLNKQDELIFLDTGSSSQPWLTKKLSSKQIGIIVFIVLLLITVMLLVHFDIIPLFPKRLIA